MKPETREDFFHLAVSYIACVY